MKENNERSEKLINLNFWILLIGEVDFLIIGFWLSKRLIRFFSVQKGLIFLLLIVDRNALPLEILHLTL